MSEWFHCWCVRAVTAVSLTLGSGSVIAWAGESDFKVWSGPNVAEVKILAELDEPTEIQFIEAPLSDVLLYLKDRHGVQFIADQPALDDAGIGTDTPVTVDLRGISLRSALKLLLRNIELTYVVRDEVLLITTPQQQQEQKHEQRQVTKVYSVADLLGDSSAEDLANVIRTMRGDQSNAGRIAVYRDLLIIRETDRIHEEFSKLLGIMRRLLETAVTSRPSENSVTRRDRRKQ